MKYLVLIMLVSMSYARQVQAGMGTCLQMGTTLRCSDGYSETRTGNYTYQNNGVIRIEEQGTTLRITPPTSSVNSDGSSDFKPVPNPVFKPSPFQTNPALNGNFDW